MVGQFTCFETHPTNQHFSNYNLEIIKHQCHIEIEMVTLEKNCDNVSKVKF